MGAKSRTSFSRVAVALAVTGSLIAGVATAPAQTAREAAASVSNRGVDGVKLGKTYAELRAHGRIGKIRQGCELSGPNARSAKLRLPLKGSVDFTRTLPRRVATVTVRGGATAHGVGIGDTIADIQSAFPHAVVDHSTEAVFAITLVKIPHRDGGHFQFAVSVSTGKIILIGIPRIAFCE
jgi:hypothetical protein